MKIAYKKSTRTEKTNCLVINLFFNRKSPTLKEIHYALTQFPGRFA
ncbi:hypothetical protein [Mucilaginibacter terrigena]|nr:hypothetical protein [Mucilaginibacter terrigena]